MKKYKNYIGVDPSFRKGGFGIAIIEGKKVEFKTFKNGFLEFQYFIQAQFGDYVVCIENSNLQNKSFDTTGSKGVVARKSRNVGTNQAVSQLTVDYCKKKHYLFTIEVSPKQKGKKWTKATALSVMKQNGLTSNKTTISQDEIDGLQLALMGKNRIVIELSKLKK